MTTMDVTFQDRHLAQLRTILSRANGSEAAAYVLFGQAVIGSDPWDRRARRRLLSYDVVPVPSEDEVSADSRHVTWTTDSFVRLLRRAKEEGLVPAIVHTHPHGPAAFSMQDDRNERDLFKLTRNRNGRSASLASVLLSGADDVLCRLWVDDGDPIPSCSVTTVGNGLTLRRGAPGGAVDEAFVRQALAFGSDLNRQLKGMKVGVVGCGGTGSATAMLLARLGVGQLVLIDNDLVETSNLNRLHGAGRSDADGMVAKVEVVAREIARAGLGVRAVPIREWVGAPECRDALKSCDMVFGCTDDHDGRLFLNRFAYFYLIPVIDMGLAIEPGVDGMKDLSGRVTVVTPGAPCLVCRGIVDPVIASEQALKRERPEDYDKLKREAYVRGGGNPAPAVVTFTTATACLAVDEMLQGLTGFRGNPGWAWQRYRRFDKLVDRRPGATSSPTCPVCADQFYWGLGDVDPFLDRTG